MPSNPPAAFRARKYRLRSHSLNGLSINKFLILLVGDFLKVDKEGIDRRHMSRLFIFTAVIPPDAKLSAGHKNHSLRDHDRDGRWRRRRRSYRGRRWFVLRPYQPHSHDDDRYHSRH